MKSIQIILLSAMTTLFFPGLSSSFAESCGSHGKESQKDAKHHGEMKKELTKHGPFKKVPMMDSKFLDGFYSNYLGIQAAFAGDDLKSAKTSTEKLWKTVKDLKSEGDEKAFIAHLKESVSGISKADGIDKARDNFFHLSNLTIALLEQNKYNGDFKALVFHCPMAFNNKGANWLQSVEGTKNPYYGKSMLACGKKTRTITPKE
ncbi:DUF3347 domain-containing protein [Fibrobacterota bacterium]